MDGGVGPKNAYKVRHSEITWSVLLCGDLTLNLEDSSIAQEYLSCGYSLSISVLVL